MFGQNKNTNTTLSRHSRSGFNKPAPSQSRLDLGRRHKPDYWILILTALLMVIGLVVVYAISPALAASQGLTRSNFVTKQVIDVGLGIVAFFIASSISLNTWRKLVTPLLMAAILGSLIVMVTPINEIYPAHRWIRVGGFSMQVAELIKLALIVWLAHFFTEQWRAGKISDIRSLKPLLIILLFIGVVVAKMQSDLGSAAVMTAIMGLMAFSIGIPLRRVAAISVLILSLAVVAIASSGYRRERLATFLHPQSDCQGSSYHICQALISEGSGGIFGLGLGYTVQAYGYLPEASNDSIFAIMGEKFGFIGCVTILAIYGAFIFRLKYIIERTADTFSRLIVVGVLAWFSTQMVINIGSMLALLPMKGITLPLISQGGTSLLFLTAAFGLVYQISRYTSYDVIEPKTPVASGPSGGDLFDRRRVGRPHNPGLVTRPRT